MAQGKLGFGFMRLDGEDITAQVREAWDFLVEHAFVM